MNKPNVLFLTSWFPDRITRTNGDFIKRHAQAVALKYRVDLIFVKYDGEMQSKEEVFVSEEGNYHEKVVYFRCSGAFKRLKKTWYFFKIYMREIKQYSSIHGKPSIIHANITYPIGMLAYYLKKRFNIPYVISEHWSAYLPTNSAKLSPVRKFIDRKIIANAACIMPVTDNLKESMLGLGYAGNYSKVPNVVDVERFRPKENGKRKIKRFIHLSTLYDEVKNISGMIEAVRQLSQIRDDFRVDIYGFAELDKHKKNALDAGILDKFIFFHGEIPYQNVPEKLSGSDALLMFSNFESLPCVIVEALACGIPVISTEVGGINEYISNDQGILIKKGDVQALVNAMTLMLDTYSSYNTQQLSEFARKNFGADSIAGQFGEIYKRVIYEC